MLLQRCQRTDHGAPASADGIAARVYVERDEQADDRFLADFHRARDAALLQFARVDQIAMAGDESHRRAADRFAAGIGDEIGAEFDVAAQIFFGGGIDDHRHVMALRRGDAIGERDHVFLNAVVRLHVQQRDDVVAVRQRVVEQRRAARC